MCVVEGAEWWVFCVRVGAQGAGVVSLGLEGGVRDIIIGEGGVSVNVFGMAAGVFAALAKSADVGDGGGEQGVPGGGGEADFMWGGGNQVHVSEEPALVSLGLK